MISEERVREILAAHSDLDAAADALINDANEAGGRDNITVVLFRLEEVADGLGTADQETMVGMAGIPGPSSGDGDADAGGDSGGGGRVEGSRGSSAVAVVPPPTRPTLRRLAPSPPGGTRRLNPRVPVVQGRPPRFIKPIAALVATAIARPRLPTAQ